MLRPNYLVYIKKKEKQVDCNCYSLEIFSESGSDLVY